MDDIRFLISLYTTKIITNTLINTICDNHTIEGYILAANLLYNINIEDERNNI